MNSNMFHNHIEEEYRVNFCAINIAIKPKNLFDTLFMTWNFIFQKLSRPSQKDFLSDWLQTRITW